MSEPNNMMDKKDPEIFSKVLRAGKRTYFFDVKETAAGDYYLTITESKKNIEENGSTSFKKFKIYLYKEDFKNFREILEQTTSFIFEQTGEKVISERHKDDFNLYKNKKQKVNSLSEFTKVSYDDL